MSMYIPPKGYADYHQKLFRTSKKIIKRWIVQCLTQVCKRWFDIIKLMGFGDITVDVGVSHHLSRLLSILNGEQSVYSIPQFISSIKFTGQYLGRKKAQYEQIKESFFEQLNTLSIQTAHYKVTRVYFDLDILPPSLVSLSINLNDCIGGAVTELAELLSPTDTSLCKLPNLTTLKLFHRYSDDQDYTKELKHWLSLDSKLKSFTTDSQTYIKTISHKQSLQSVQLLGCGIKMKHLISLLGLQNLQHLVLQFDRFGVEEEEDPPTIQTWSQKSSIDKDNLIKAFSDNQSLRSFVFRQANPEIWDLNLREITSYVLVWSLVFQSVFAHNNSIQFLEIDVKDYNFLSLEFFESLSINQSIRSLKLGKLSMEQMSHLGNYGLTNRIQTLCIRPNKEIVYSYMYSILDYNKVKQLQIKELGCLKVASVSDMYQLKSYLICQDCSIDKLTYNHKGILYKYQVIFDTSSIPPKKILVESSSFYSHI